MRNSDHPTERALIAPYTEEKIFPELYVRIKKLALLRAALMLDDVGEDHRFDAGARSLRTLVGAAEITRRLKGIEEKDNAPDDAKEFGSLSTDERLKEIYRETVAKVERLERETVLDAGRLANGEPIDGGADGQIRREESLGEPGP